MYSDLYTHSRISPTKILSSVAIFILVSLGIFVYTQDATPTRASKQALLDHQTVNISPKQFGIFWEVDTADDGWIIYGNNPNKLDKIAFDERDSGGEKEKRVYHFALLRNLVPEETYYYKIISNNEVIHTENTNIFNEKTLDDSAQTSTFSPMYGTVLFPNNEPAEKILTMLIIGNAHPIMAVSGPTGEWLIPLQHIINKDSNKAVGIGENDPITIQIFNDTQRSMVRSTFARSRPLPQAVVLGNNYSFIADSDVLAVQDRNQSTALKSNNRVEIRYPKQNAVIPGTAPLVKGYGVSGEYVSVQINSLPGFSARVRVNQDGEWDVPVKIKIPPGTYTVTVTTKDKNDNTVQMDRRFTLIKSGEQVLGESDEATPSGTITPSTNPSVTVIITTPTPAETIIIDGPTVTPAPPVSGLNIVPYIFAGVGFVVFGLGIILFL